ncbi:Ulp1 protease family [Abeliophyllum distichum]|uniref:Ulp1 protease family n=1 Tax=Abeliophyllum distichum TaxID=126358 RepID=A0ABD1RUU0_9LAMI
MGVHNLSFKTIRDVAVLDAVEPLRHIIPHLLRTTKVLSYGTPYAPLSYRLCKDIPQQTNGGDCGIFVLKYAEYLFQKMIDDMPNKFDTRMARYNVVVQLYKFAITKPDIPLLKLVK